MAMYELLVLVKPSIADDETGAVAEKLQGVIERLGGQVTQTSNWGKKKLTYEIQKEKKATYLVFRLDASGTAAADIGRACRLDESVMRAMIVRTEAVVEPPAVAVPEAHDQLQ